MKRSLDFYLYASAGILILLLSGPAHAGETPDYINIAKSGLTRMDATNVDEDWFFTMTVHVDDEILVSRNDPLKEKGERRELITVNGEEPSAERLQEFAEQEEARLANREKQEEQKQYSDMVGLSTLTLMDTSDQQVHLGFTPELEGFEDDKENLKGNLSLNANTQLIEELTIFNTGKISPAFSVSVKTFRMSLSFVPIDGELLLDRMTSTVEGKVGFLKKFNSNAEIVFSDYQRKQPGQAVDESSP